MGADHGAVEKFYKLLLAAPMPPACTIRGQMNQAHSQTALAGHECMDAPISSVVWVD